MRLIDADGLIDAILGEDVFGGKSEFDSETRRKIIKYINDAPTALKINPALEELEKSSSEFCGVKFLSLNQARSVVWGICNGKTE